MNDTTEIPTTTDLLKSARQRITNPDNWWDGRTLSWADGKFCAVQTMAMSLQELERVDSHTASIECFGALLNALPPTWRWRSVAKYNDTHVHSSILRLFDRAIAAMEVTE